MTTLDLPNVLPNLFAELVDGSPDPTVGTYMLNRGDGGLLRSLDSISALAASTTTTGGATIAAHVEHLRYGLSLLNRWAAGDPAPWKGADWTAAWRKPSVTDLEWRTLRGDLARETATWRAALAVPRDGSNAELRWVVGSIAHLAYHLGAIRQIDRAARGPTAEDERVFQVDG